ncbi:hypothetical protein [Acidovorax sp.]|uniref:hypothetical protein n=1 Tax=Acidovorax sp. TaxID=1872122 RepID=UPI00391F5256
MTTSENSLKVVTMVLAAYSSSENADGPSFATFEITRALIDRCLQLEQLASEHCLSEVRISASPVWTPREVENQLRLQCGELVLDVSGAMHFTDYPKYGDFVITSETLQIDDIRRAFDTFPDGAVVRRTNTAEFKLQSEVQPRYVISRGWPHYFDQERSSDTRWMYDSETHSLVHAEILVEGEWLDMSQADKVDLLESLNENGVHTNPEDLDVEQTNSSECPFEANNQEREAASA